MVCQQVLRAGLEAHADPGPGAALHDAVGFERHRYVAVPVLAFRVREDAVRTET